MGKVHALWAAFFGCTSAYAVAQETLSSGGVFVSGLVDVGLNHVTGGPNSTQNTISSGNMLGSGFTFRGDEDLGGGYHTIFTLESRFESDTGAFGNRAASLSKLPDGLSGAASLMPDVYASLPAAQQAALQQAVSGVASSIASRVGVNLEGSLFYRQAFAGLVTPIGAFTLGRQYTPAYYTTANFDVMRTESSLSLGQLFTIPVSFDVRMSNSIQYGLQQNGVSATAMYAVGEVAGETKANRLLGVMAFYDGPGYSFGGGYNTRNNEFGKKSLSTSLIGATLAIGPGTLHGQYGSIKDDHPTGFSGIASSLQASGVPASIAGRVQDGFYNGFKQDARLFQVGYRIVRGIHTVSVAYNHMNDRRPLNADRYSYGAAYTHALSKRTDLNAVLTHLENKNSSQIALGGNGFVGGVTSAAGKDSNSLALVIRHRF